MGAEDLEQVAVIAWADTHLDLYPEVAYLFHVPNGGLRAKTTAIRLKLMGVRRGISDLILLVPRGGFHGLLIELKIMDGAGRKSRVSKEQKAFISFEQRQGYCAVICYDRFEAIRTIIAYLTYQMHWPKVAVR